jgi:hypothetical protein
LFAKQPPHVTNQFKQVIRRWLRPEELPDSPVWKDEGERMKDEQDRSSSFRIHPSSFQKGYPAKQQAGAIDP